MPYHLIFILHIRKKKKEIIKGVFPFWKALLKSNLCFPFNLQYILLKGHSGHIMLIITNSPSIFTIWWLEMEGEWMYVRKYLQSFVLATCKALFYYMSHVETYGEINSVFTILITISDLMSKITDSDLMHISSVYEECLSGWRKPNLRTIFEWYWACLM